MTFNYGNTYENIKYVLSLHLIIISYGRAQHEFTKILWIIFYNNIYDPARCAFDILCPYCTPPVCFEFCTQLKSWVVVATHDFKWVKINPDPIYHGYFLSSGKVIFYIGKQVILCDVVWWLNTTKAWCTINSILQNLCDIFKIIIT